MEDLNEDVFEPENGLKRLRNEQDSKSPKKKMKQPTVEELNELNEAQTLFKSNLFRLQIRELINATTIKNKYKLKLTKWIEDFQSFLNTLPVHDPINISNFSREAKTRPSRDLRFIKNLINNCKNNLLCDQDIPVTLVRPETIGTFGLYKIDSWPGPNISINLHLTIPKKCLLEKDYLNNRYFVKKFYYLMYLADHLKSQSITSCIKCGYYYENIMLPHLIITPYNLEKIVVNLFLIPEPNYFKLNRVLPDVNNVKTCEIFEKNCGKIENLRDYSTSFYNASLGFDFTLNENNLYIEQMITNPNIQEGLKMLIVWLNQRKLNEGLGAFSEDLIVYLLLYMIIKRKINNLMSSYQVFRSFMNYMSGIDLTQISLSINEEIRDDALAKFKEKFDIVVLDKTGCYNVASFLNVNVYRKFKEECKLAFKTLDQDYFDSFTSLFLVKVPRFLQYDAIIDIKNDYNLQPMLENLDVTKRATYLGQHSLLFMKLLQDYLQIGLNKRAINIVPFVNEKSTWEYGERYEIQNPRILYGIVLDPDCAFDILEFGPLLNDPQEKDFREFWGKFTSNRRFRDGTARIVVHFENTKTIKDKREIIKTIIDFVLNEKLKLNFKFFYNSLEKLVTNPHVNCWYPSGTNEETCIKIIRASDELGKKIRALDLQLGISGITGISNVSCYTNVFPPIPTIYHGGKTITSLVGHNITLKERKIHASPKYVEPIELVINLEHSSKWPNELEAFRKMKTLFLLQISKLLKEDFKIVSTVKQSSYIDVLYEGIIFRFHLYISKEIGLLKKTRENNKMLAYKDTEFSLEIERKFVILPKIIGALKGIQSQFPSFGVGSCLAKRWIRSQLIDEYLLPDVVVDLLCAQQFTGSTIYPPAVNPQVTFMRFLKFLSDFRCDIEPAVVNFNDELIVQQVSKIDNDLRTNREKYPTLTILTPYDLSGAVFTKENPTKEVLIRLNILARESLNILEKTVVNQSLFNLKELFIPNIEGFDCLIHLQSLINPRRHENLQRIDEDVSGDSKINYTEPNNSENEQLIPVIGFDPVQLYLKELRKSYGSFCVFFHDSYGGNYIGVIWNPKELEKKDVKLSYIPGRKIENDKLVLDFDEIIKGFNVLGKDIVKSIDFQN